MPVPSVGLTSASHTRPDPERYILSVRVLWQHIREEDRDTKLNGLWQTANKGNRKFAIEGYEDLHHWILEKVEEKQLLAGKVRRTLVGA